MACERDPLRSDAARWPHRIAQREPEEVPMAIVGGLDIHRRQITFDYLDTATGETCRGQLSPATRLELRAWLDQFDPQQASFALEATTGWRFVTEELERVGIDVHLAEPADTRASCCALARCPSHGRHRPTSPTPAPRSGYAVRWSVRGPAGTSASTRCCSITVCPTAATCSPPTGGRGWPASNCPRSPAARSISPCG